MYGLLPKMQLKKPCNTLKEIEKQKKETLDLFGSLELTQHPDFTECPIVNLWEKLNLIKLN